jgi:hypothetical protein
MMVLKCFMVQLKMFHLARIDFKLKAHGSTECHTALSSRARVKTMTTLSTFRSYN